MLEACFPDAAAVDDAVTDVLNGVWARIEVARCPVLPLPPARSMGRMALTQALPRARARTHMHTSTIRIAACHQQRRSITNKVVEDYFNPDQTLIFSSSSSPSP